MGQLLYRVSGNGLAAPSYIVGTYHLAPVTFVDSIPGLRAALAASQQVYGEIDLSGLDAGGMAGMAKETMRQALLTGDTTLTSLLTEAEQKRLNEMLRSTMGADLTSPFVGAQLTRMKPSALEATLSLLLCLKQEPGFNPSEPFDAYFQREARKAGKPVGGFETATFQADVLYNRMPLARQAKQLMCFVDHQDFAVAQLRAMRSAFFSQDTARIVAAIEMELGEGCEADPEAEAALTTRRNAAWLAQLSAIMRERPTLVAVGAAHLFGAEGLIAGLRGKGYDVAGVKGEE